MKKFAWALLIVALLATTVSCEAAAESWLDRISRFWSQTVAPYTQGARNLLNYMFSRPGTPQPSTLPSGQPIIPLRPPYTPAHPQTTMSTSSASLPVSAVTPSQQPSTAAQPQPNKIQERLEHTLPTISQETATLSATSSIDNLRYAIINKDDKKFREILEHSKIDPNHIMSDGDPLLLYVVFIGTPGMVKELLDRKADPNAQGRNSKKIAERGSILGYAIINDQFDKSALLLEAGADPTATLPFLGGMTLLEYALDFDQPALFKLLKNKGATLAPGKLTSKFKRMLSSDRSKELKLWLDAGIYPTEPSFLEYILQNTITGGNTNVLAMLLDGELDPNSRIGKESLLACVLKYANASRNKNNKNVRSLVTLLLARGANPNFTMQNGESLLEYCLTTNMSKDIIDDLLNKGAQVTYKVFVEAVQRGNLPIVTMALNKGMNAHYKDKDGVYLLDHALDHGEPHIAKILLEHGAQPTPQSLSHAVEAGSPMYLIESLLKKGAKPNTTVLEIAIKQGKTDVVTLLLNHGVQLSDRFKDGTSIIHYTYDKKNFDLLKVIAKQGISLDTLDSRGNTVLLRSLADHNSNATATLIELGANPLIRDKNGLNAFDWASTNPNILRILSKSAYKQIVEQEQAPKDIHGPSHAALYRTLAGKAQQEKELEVPSELYHQASEQTISEIYAKILQKEILKKYGDAIERYKIDIFRLINREREYWKTHYVFYHAQEAIHRIAQDFWLEIMALLGLHYPENFIPIRFPELDSTLEKIDIQKFLLDNKILPNCQNDNYGPRAQHLLSVNIALFGNLDNEASSSLYYYLNNQSATNLSLSRIMQEISIYYDFNKNLLKVLSSLETSIDLFRN